MTMPAMDHTTDYKHITVMAAEVVECLSPRSSGVYLDVTLGGGGHADAILSACDGCRVVGFDRDEWAIAAAGERLERFGDRFTARHARFSDAKTELAALGIDRVDGLVADLGVSSPQLDDGERGMSFRKPGPLDMRMDRTRGETAAELIARLSQDELADVIYQYGEERRSRRVARCIKQALEAGELDTTLDLRRAIVRAVGPRRVGGIDPATRTFQALRLAVNRELEELGRLLELAPDLVKPHGVAVFISFHSLEDRLVKRALLARDTWQRLTKKPRIPSSSEQADNPRARSAKLRAAERLPSMEDIDGEHPMDSADFDED